MGSAASGFRVQGLRAWGVQCPFLAFEHPDIQSPTNMQAYITGDITQFKTLSP